MIACSACGAPVLYGRRSVGKQTCGPRCEYPLWDDLDKAARRLLRAWATMAESTRRELAVRMPREMVEALLALQVELERLPR